VHVGMGGADQDDCLPLLNQSEDGVVE
jgi:hypothetical protein